MLLSRFPGTASLGRTLVASATMASPTLRPLESMLSQLVCPYREHRRSPAAGFAAAPECRESPAAESAHPWEHRRTRTTGFVRAREHGRTQQLSLAPRPDHRRSAAAGSTAAPEHGNSQPARLSRAREHRNSQPARFPRAREHPDPSLARFTRAPEHKNSQPAHFTRTPDQRISLPAHSARALAHAKSSHRAVHRCSGASCKLIRSDRPYPRASGGFEACLDTKPPWKKSTSATTFGLHVSARRAAWCSPSG
jgi:hypothetical protein